MNEKLKLLYLAAIVFGIYASFVLIMLEIAQ